LVFITEMKSVYCEVRTGSLKKTVFVWLNIKLDTLNSAAV
jgi:hypothetical protein